MHQTGLKQEFGSTEQTLVGLKKIEISLKRDVFTQLLILRSIQRLLRFSVRNFAKTEMKMEMYDILQAHTLF